MNVSWAYHLNQRSDLLESLASEAAKENLSITVRTLDVTKKVTKSIKSYQKVSIAKKSVPSVYCKRIKVSCRDI